MAVEKKWLGASATPFTSDGGKFGVVTVADTAGFKVKGFAAILANTLPPLQVQIQRVVNKTTMIVGILGSQPALNFFIDVSAYTVAKGATIAFPEQDKNKIKPDDIFQAVYEADPTVALRTVFVDQYGNFYNNNNPLPIIFDGTVSIGEVEVIGKNGNTIEPNSDGSINVNFVETPIVGHIVKTKYNEIASVPSGANTQILSYTVPPASTAILQRIVTSGENVARYDVYLNGISVDTQRTYYGGDFNALFEFITGNSQGIVLVAGDVILVKVLHNRPFVGNFNARIQILEIV